MNIQDLRQLRNVSLQTMQQLKKAIGQWWSYGCCDLYVLTQLEIIKAKLENFIARIEIAIREELIQEAENNV